MVASCGSAAVISGDSDAVAVGPGDSGAFHTSDFVGSCIVMRGFEYGGQRRPAATRLQPGSP